MGGNQNEVALQMYFPPFKAKDQGGRNQGPVGLPQEPASGDLLAADFGEGVQGAGRAQKLPPVANHGAAQQVPLDFARELLQGLVRVAARDKEEFAEDLLLVAAGLHRAGRALAGAAAVRAGVVPRHFAGEKDVHPAGVVEVLRV